MGNRQCISKTYHYAFPGMATLTVTGWHLILSVLLFFLVSSLSCFLLATAGLKGFYDNDGDGRSKVIVS